LVDLPQQLNGKSIKKSVHVRFSNIIICFLIPAPIEISLYKETPCFDVLDLIVDF
jgi:hypothetical protein